MKLQFKIAHILPQIRGPRRHRPVCVVEGFPAAPVGPAPSSSAVAVAVDVLDVVLELEPARDVDERGQGEDEEGLDVAVSESAKKGKNAVQQVVVMGMVVATAGAVGFGVIYTRRVPYIVGYTVQAAVSHFLLPRQGNKVR